MVRYPHTGILKTPGTVVWVEGKATIGAGSEETVQCDVQPDGSNYQQDIQGKVIVSQYSVFMPNIYLSVSTASTFVFAGIEYNIIQKYINQLDVQFKIG